MKEYKIAKGWLYFIYVIAIGFTVPSSYYLGRYFITGNYVSEPLGQTLFFTLGYLAVLVFLFLGIKDGLRGKFVIDSNKISSTTIFKYRELFFDEIKGYRKAEKGGLIIESNIVDKKPIAISQYLSKYGEIELWFLNRYVDLNTQEAEQEKEEILNDENLGATVDERTSKLAKARLLSNIINFGSIGLIICLFILADSHLYLQITCLFLPLLIIVITKTSKGLITLSPTDKKTPRPSLFFLLSIASIVLLMTEMFSIHILEYSALWTPLIILTIIIVVIANSYNTEFSKTKPGGKVLLLFLSLIWATAYSYGVIVNLNCHFDKSNASIYETKIIRKTISKGKHTSYYLLLSPWGPELKETNIEVGRTRYDEYEEGETIHVNLKKGAFNIPWYYINH